LMPVPSIYPLYKWDDKFFNTK